MEVVSTSWSSVITTGTLDKVADESNVEDCIKKAVQLIHDERYLVAEELLRRIKDFCSSYEGELKAKVFKALAFQQGLLEQCRLRAVEVKAALDITDQVRPRTDGRTDRRTDAVALVRVKSVRLSYSVLPLACLGLPQSSVNSLRYGWRIARRKGGITTSYQSVDGRDGLRIRVEGQLSGSIFAQLAVLRETQLYHTVRVCYILHSGLFFLFYFELRIHHHHHHHALASGFRSARSRGCSASWTGPRPRMASQGRPVGWTL